MHQNGILLCINKSVVLNNLVLEVRCCTAQQHRVSLWIVVGKNTSTVHALAAAVQMIVKRLSVSASTVEQKRKSLCLYIHHECERS